MRLALVVCGIWCCSVGVASADEGTAFFESRIRPLLVEHCYKCHSGAKTKGGLALDTRAGWTTGGDSGPALAPGKPDESLLIKAVRYEDEGLAMPPSGKLSDEQIALLVEWVRRGAPDPRVAGARIGGMGEAEAKGWWAFQPIAAPPVPAVRGNEGQVRNDIDRYILARLESEGLSPVAPADRRTLIRRATYDLTGLPPTAEEVDAFVQDPDLNAFAKVVDRLLASPQYGEQWGRHWLDVVRYADTAGENTDRPLPHIWRYRNWVFDALNHDLPYDDFVRMQLAGDIILKGDAGATPGSGIVATGYLAVARRFGHDSDKDIHLMHEDVIDNLGKTYLGLTLACARCHDHKYDPVSMHDYYALYGILASSRFSFAGCEAKGQPRDLVPMLSAAELDELQRPWRERIAQSEPRLKEAAARSAQARERLMQALGSATTVLASADVGEGGAVTLKDGEQQPLDQIAVRKGEILQLVVSPQGSHGADSTRVEWEIAEQTGPKRRFSVSDLIPVLLAGNPNPGTPAAAAQWCFLDMQNGPAFLSEKVDVVQNRKEIKTWRNGDTPSVFVNASDQPISVWTQLPANSLFVHPGPKGPVAIAWISPLDGMVAISGRVSDVHPAGGDGVAFRLEQIAAVDAGPALASIGETAREQAEIIRQRDAEAGPEPVSPVAFAVVEAAPKNVPLQQRGDPEKPGAEVPRRWLSVFGGDPVAADGGSGRRALAESIVRNPLSTRVIVNRVWQGHFGKGLVRTLNDFGSRGERPTHPELLNWLSARFERDGRGLKSLHRLIMLSAAYQRGSTVSETLAQRDPDNRLLARFDRRRLTAEELRDSLLAAGGNLDRAPGAAHPFPPEASWGFTQHSPFSAVYDNTKRTAYQMVQRQRRHPFLALFDGADPNASTSARQTTIAPTQALFFLNDPFFHDQAAAVAKGAGRGSGDAARVGSLYRIVLQREPTVAERKWAANFLASYPASAEDQWAALSRVLLSSNEFLYLD